MKLSRLRPDTTALRESRELRSLVLGNFVSGMGTQAGLVALPFQLYVITGSPFLTGLLGAAELVPLVTASLWGGALGDRFDRRPLLLGIQVALVAVAAGLAAAAFAGTPPVWLLYVLAGLAAGASAIERVTRAAIVPNTVRPERLRGALSLTFGLYQLTMVIGPAVGGVLIAALGVDWVYAIDAASCLGMVVAAWMMGPQAPIGAEEHEPVMRSIGTGLAFVRRSRALV